MKNKVLLIIGLVMIVLLAGLAGCATTSAQSPVTVNMNSQQGIWVSGEGKVTVTPDIATISLGVYAEAEKVADAQAQAAQDMDNIMAVLKSNGIADKDIQTTYFSVDQVTKWDSVKQESVVTGYRVSNIVTVKIREVDNTGKVIDAVAAAAGDNTRITGISFSVEEPEKYYAEARELAMNDAKAKAESIAELAGVELGEPTYVTESTGTTPYTYPVYKGLDMAASESYTTSISAGETDIILNVQINYTIN